MCSGPSDILTIERRIIIFFVSIFLSISQNVCHFNHILLDLFFGEKGFLKKYDITVYHYF